MGLLTKSTPSWKSLNQDRKNLSARWKALGVEPRSVGEVESREVEVTVPSRLHPTVLDMNRFNLNKPGGGGLGFAIEVYMHAKVRSTKNPDIVVKGERTLLMQHYGHAVSSSY